MNETKKTLEEATTIFNTCKQRDDCMDCEFYIVCVTPMYLAPPRFRSPKSYMKAYNKGVIVQKLDKI